MHLSLSLLFLGVNLGLEQNKQTLACHASFLPGVHNCNESILTRW